MNKTSTILKKLSWRIPRNAVALAGLYSELCREASVEYLRDLSGDGHIKPTGETRFQT